MEYDGGIRVGIIGNIGYFSGPRYGYSVVKGKKFMLTELCRLIALAKEQLIAPPRASVQGGNDG